MDPVFVSGDVFVPGDAIELIFARSSGPGGQNVNKVSSKVQLRVSLHAICGLPADALLRLRSLAGKRVDARDCLLIMSQKTRDQVQNIEDARTKLAEMVRQALIVPEARTPTRPTRSSVRRRVEDKRRMGMRKQQRRVANDD